MTQDEINASPESANAAQIQAAMLDLHTALPAMIVSFDPATRTATVQPAIQRIFSADDGTDQPTNLPPCVDVPVYFPSGGGFELTFPVKTGDHCLLIFAERCIDGWFTGGDTPTAPDDYRQHDLSDAFALVGVWPRGKRPAVWMDGAELRSEGDYLRLSGGKLQTNCMIECKDLKTQTIASVNAHQHGGVLPGPSLTSPPL